MPSEVTAIAASVAKALATGVSRLARSAHVSRSSAGAAAAHVERLGAGVTERPRGRRQCQHVEEHALDVGMGDDRAHAIAGGSRRPALAARAGIGERLPTGPRRDADALNADAEAGEVHHREHAGEAAILLADQPAGRPGPGAAVDHRAGGGGVQAELAFDAGDGDVVAARRRRARFGTRNMEMPRVPGGASGSRASTRWTMFSVRSCSP